MSCSQHRRTGDEPTGYWYAAAALWGKAGKRPLLCPPPGALFNQFSPLAIRCVWLVAKTAYLLPPAVGLGVAITSHQHFDPIDMAAWEQSRLSLKCKLAMHTWKSHFLFLKWKIKSSEFGKRQIFICLASLNLASCLCVLAWSSVIFVMDSFFPRALIHLKFSLVTKLTLQN